jgi:hypothetical protein
MATHLRDPSHIIPGTKITKRLLFLDLKTHSEPLNFEIIVVYLSGILKNNYRCNGNANILYYFQKLRHSSFIEA